MCVVLMVFAGRLVQIQAVDAEHYAAEAASIRLARYQIPTTRGDISDVNGEPFAFSVETRTVFVDPSLVQDRNREEIIERLSAYFDKDRAEVAEKVSAEDTRYKVIARGVAPEKAEKFAKNGYISVGSSREFERHYPGGEGASNLIGFVGSDGSGLEGLEANLDETLAGQPGKQQVQMGDSGQPIPMAGGLQQEPVPGKDVRLTLNRDIQWHAEQALADQVEALDAKGGSVIAMRPTGEIVAMANYPTYDPNDISGTTPEDRENGAVADVFEPGSTNKVITAAAALESGAAEPESVYTIPYSIERYGSTFSDSHFHETQKLTLNGIIATSSNVGAIKLAEEVGAQGLYTYLRKFGFGQPTGLGLPGASAGLLKPPDEWWGTQLATISFGQGLGVNAVQMASVYATIANGGVRAQPTVVAGTADEESEITPAEDPPKERVVSEETAKELRKMLEAVTGENGTAQQASIPGYRVGGKTGTAQRVNPETGSYQGGGYTSTFVGFAPVEDPELIVQVVLHDPQEEYYGGEAAAPVFTDVMSFAMKTLEVPPTETDPPNIRLFAK